MPVGLTCVGLTWVGRAGFNRAGFVLAVVAFVMGDQRLSCLVLQSTHKVARGAACRRSLPMALPQVSHTP